MIRQHHIPIQRTGRFATLGARQAEIDEIWFVLHGYGQLAVEFIEPFENILDEGRFFVAPEALSRFYVKRNPSRIGASWMTREDREQEINDYLAFLNQTANYVFDWVGKPARTVVFGFSQGANTASRWVTLGRFPADRLILWGGDIAQDLDLTTYAPVFSAMNTTLVVGDQDSYISTERLEQEIERLETNQISFELITFDGGHAVDPSVLQSLV